MQHGTVHILRTRSDEVRRRAQARGLLTDSDLAAHVGISQTTIWRLLRGDIKPGEHAVANILAAFPEAKFEDLFEVVRSDAA